MVETDRNAHGFTLTVTLLHFVNGEWSGDAVVTFAACPKAACFHLTGPASFPINPKSQANEGTFAVPGQKCGLHFAEIPRDGMDSGDWRVRAVETARGGCASLPPGLAGDYVGLDTGK